MDRSEREHDPRGFLRTVTRRNATYSLAPSLRSLDSERERESLVTYSWDSSFPEIEREEKRDFKVVAELSGFAIR